MATACWKTWALPSKLVAMLSAVTAHLGVKTEADHEVGELKQDVAPDAVLDEIEEPGFHRRLDHLGVCLRHGMEEAIADAGLEATVIGDGPLAQVVFRRGPVTSSREIWQSAPGLGRRLMLGLFARGVFLNPMGTKLYLSAAHDEQVIADFLGRFRSALADLVA